jgi:nitrate/nitrite-specific signal transduction histidine kinase
MAAMVISSISGISQAGITTTDEAINIAGKQRMITQRAMKDYALVGMNIDLGDPASDLEKLVELFDSSLDDLKGFSTTERLNSSLADIDSQWQPVKVILMDKPDRARAAQLQEDLDKLLATCHGNTLLIAQSEHNSKGNIVNLAGKQRMLSQRMAALYMLKAWKLDDPKFREKLTNAMDEFSTAQKALETSPLTTDEIGTLLAKVKKSYAWFEMMGRSKSSRVIPNLINKSANSILTDMDKATALYANTKQ